MYNNLLNQYEPAIRAITHTYNNQCVLVPSPTGISFCPSPSLGSSSYCCLSSPLPPDTYLALAVLSLSLLIVCIIVGVLICIELSYDNTSAYFMKSITVKILGYFNHI